MNKKKLLCLIILLAVLAGFFAYRIKIKNLFLELNKTSLPTAIDFNQNAASATTTAKTIVETKTDPAARLVEENPNVAKTPLTFNLNVPFISQAPTGNWNADFKEACEEASLLMVNNYFTKTSLSAKQEEDALIKLINWQKENWQGHFDLTVKQTADLAFKTWAYQSKIIDNPSIDDIKKLISAQRPVIVPAAGQELNNPHYKTPGPIYHMLVIKGYTKTQFITNDPGTKFGQDYLYDFDVILEVMRDWNNNGDIRQGAKRIMVIYPN